MTAEEKRAFVDGSQWFHRIDLGDGIVTPGTQDIVGILSRARIPDDLTGKTVLDVGANDGWFSFECERRGGKVTSIDMWDRKYDGTRAIENIQFCKKALGSKIKIIQTDLFDYDPLEGFDLVLFMGVLYHLQDMMAGIRKVAAFTAKDGLAIIETHYIPGGDAPTARLYPGAELNGDPTNWWGPSKSCVEMMTGVFFDSVEVVSTYCDRLTIHARGPKS